MAADQQINQVFEPFVVGNNNDTQVKVAKFGDMFDWHLDWHVQTEENVGFFAT